MNASRIGRGIGAFEWHRIGLSSPGLWTSRDFVKPQPCTITDSETGFREQSEGML